MSDAATRFHQLWLGMVQPIDGLVVSTPVLVDAQCMERQPPEAQHRLLELCPPFGKNADKRAIADVGGFVAELLGLTPDLFDGGDALPEDLSLYVPEGRQTLRPTMALRKVDGGESQTPQSEATDARTPHSIAGEKYVVLVWEIPIEVDLDTPEAVTGPWEYPASAKFDRLLRNCRVPIGLITNRREMRLVYAPHGESSGSITFRIDDMASVGGRPILDAFMMLLSYERLFGVAPEYQLPTLLADSRKRQADVTNELAAQVLDAIGVLLAGFEAAAERDGRDLLAQAREGSDDHIYGGLLTTLLRLVFLLYAEDRGLLPVDHPVYARSMSILELFAELQRDRGAYPDSMDQRFGAWGRLLATFRAIYSGVAHNALQMPPRRGALFDPNGYPFLEGWDPAASAPVRYAENRAQVKIPSVSDGTVYDVLERLIIFQGQRLSYRALDVEQIGSVYEGLMGYHVVSVDAPAVCLRPARVWVTAEEVLAQPAAQRAKWLQQTTSMAKAQAEKLAQATKAAKGEQQVLEALETMQAKGTRIAAAGRIVLQPGEERRRTSSHYTPRSLSAPIVQRTLDPLIETMGKTPSSEQLLSLKICDPAMGSGAFLVEACRYLGDQVVAAWTREGKQDYVADESDDVVNYARRLVAQRCLYGVDKNPFAVSLAKLSLWLVTLAKDLPFTFVDHALRHGDSLVGLDFDQIRSFHWKANGQLPLCCAEIDVALSEAVELRERILDLAYERGPKAQREKERLLRDADDALSRVRLIGDLVVGAFFEGKNSKDREAERRRRLGLAVDWLTRDSEAPEELRALWPEARQGGRTFHWMAEFPEVFHAGRQDTLASLGAEGELAYMDAFVGNPPFMGGSKAAGALGPSYRDWLKLSHSAADARADICAHFFWRSFTMLGGHGTLGMVATNTIAQGDTRITGLRAILAARGAIYHAIPSMPWPGTSAVSIAIVNIVVGNPSRCANLVTQIAGHQVRTINSQLRAAAERADPVALKANMGLSFKGANLRGSGFVLSPTEKEEMESADAKNREIVSPYLGGEEVNSSPTQAHSRFVIDFGRRSLEEVATWPLLLERVRLLVKPARDAVIDNTGKGLHGKKYWWQFSDRADPLRAAIADLPRCLVCANVSKHLVFAFQPTDRVFANTLYVYPLPAYTHFAVLQSRLHDPWTRLHSSSMGETLRYAASDCFENFPFPDADPGTIIAPVETAGRKLYKARAAYMVETDQGLTKTYNALKDPECTCAPIVELRRLHEAMDRAVLDAYGWSDVEVPPFTTPATPAERSALEAFEDEVIDRLFVLNAERAELEKLLGEARRPAKRVGKRSKKGQDAALAAQAGDSGHAASDATGSRRRGPKRVGEKPEAKQAVRRRRAPRTRRG